VPARVSYNAVNDMATIDPKSPLGYATKYVVTVRGGAAGVKGSSSGGGMAGDVTWSFQTAAAPTSGPGGPILLVTNAGNRFSSYYAEILRAEGLNEFATADVGAVTPAVLAGHPVVVLGETPLTKAQAETLAAWVDGGGCLIAMRPDKQLAGLLGLKDAKGAVTEGYVQVNGKAGPGAGITAGEMQFHGTADLYALDGASAVASLRGREASAGAKAPAVTIRRVGTRGGLASAFTYDLARSVVYTRQGNPAWAGQERDGWKPVRSDDLFYGNAPNDQQADWVDPDKVQIPQADEQQRLLANLITDMALERVPLPRFWYLPDGHKAAVVMTGDDHALGGTNGRFDAYLNAGAAGASVEDWGAVRSTSYIYPRAWLTDSQAAQYAAAGFELALHVTTYESDWTPKTLEAFYGQQLEEFLDNYPSVPTPQTERTHSIVWSDYATQPQVEFRHRIRLDTNYYYFPGRWVQDRPGVFTGSGFPMRFATADGETIDVYQATTQMTDESGQSYPHHADVLLDNALGPSGYYGAFVTNMHTNDVASAGSDAIVAAAQARGVPVVSAAQMLRWLDGRNGSSFAGVRWDESGRSLRFTVRTAPGARGLQGMVPLVGPGGRTLRQVRRKGAEQRYTVETIKGVAYAFFSAAPGEYEAVYAGGADRPVAASAELPESSGGNPGP
jgi:hypothetical protein